MIPRKTARFTQPLVARAQAWAPHPQARRRWVLAGLSLALVTGAALFTASGVHAQAAAGAPQVPVVVVGAQAVGAGVALDGSLQAVRQSVLSAQASGRIASLSVKA
jgi:multidrug efflux pump subunit AcrA (membrane-fusion protein)